MKEQLQQYFARFDALTLRERAIVFGAALLLILFVWFIAWIEPLMKQHSQNTRAEVQLRQQLDASQAEQTVLNKRLEQDPDAGLKAEREQILAERDALREDLRESLALLIDPEQMAQVLREVLISDGSLRLLAARNLPVRIISQPEEGEESAGDSLEVLYSHGLEIEFEGSFQATRDYLARLEQLGHKFVWQRMLYRVDEHPRATVLLEIRTFSAQASWLGV